MGELSETLTREIMLRIVNNEFGEEQPFPHEMTLCAEYNVSRVVVREAKKQLQALGMVQSRKKYGSVITPRLDWNYFNQDLFSLCIQYGEHAGTAMQDYFMFRECIEPPLAARVAEKHSDAFETRLLGHLRDMEALLNEENRKPWLIADLHFHVELYQESRNLLALPLANLMRPLFLRGFEAGLDIGESNLDTHRALAEAILDRDPVQAFHFAHILVRRGSKNYLRLLRRQAESGQRGPAADDSRDEDGHECAADPVSPLINPLPSA